jgi:hypothetical protein
MSLKETASLLDIKMNGKKDKRKMNGLINVETIINMKKSIEANTKSNMNTQMNMKMRVNTMLQMKRWRCSFAVYRRDQIKTGVQERATTRRRL